MHCALHTALLVPECDSLEGVTFASYYYCLSVFLCVCVCVGSFFLATTCVTVGNHAASIVPNPAVNMAPGMVENPSIAYVESRPSKKIKFAEEANFEDDDECVAIALPSHPLGIKPAGNAYTATENIKSHCGLFARLPDELLSHILESFDADVLVRLGSTCRALYAFTRLDELWRALFVR